MNKIDKIKKELRKYSSEERKKTNEWFFKTGKGEYGEHDKFIGVRVPDLRKIAKKYSLESSVLNFSEILEILQSEIHEERLLALIILSNQSKKAWKKDDKKTLQKITKFYLKHKKYVNNWDLVDISTHYILGYYILKFPEEQNILEKMARSENLWDRRIAMIANWTMIREGKYDEVFKLSKILLDDKEDLMHKAVGWMLRETWKKEPNKVEDFLIKNYNKIPRTALRYAIEKMEEKKRKKFLKGIFR